MKSLRIRTKIFLGMVAVLAVFIIFSVLVVNRLALRMGERQVRDNLLRGVQAYELFAQLRGDIVASQARSIAQTPLLKAVMNIPEVDPETVYYTARDLYEAIGADLMLLVDTRGRLLADASRMNRSVGEMGGMIGIAEGLQGGEYSGIWPYSGELYQIALTPIVIEEQILGLLVLGDRFDSSVAAEIRQSTGKDLLVLHDGAVAIQSWEDLPQALSADELSALGGQLRDPESAAVPFRVVLGGKERLAITVPLAEAGGDVVLSRGLDELQEEIDLFDLWMLGIGLVSVLIAVLCSLWFSSRTSRPIRALSEAAEEVGAGRLGRRVEVVAADELGLLARTFNTMVERIAERTAELEREIAERKQAEAERAKLGDQLRQSQKLEAIGLLAGGIAHEINNPIGVLQMKLKFLLSVSSREHLTPQTIATLEIAVEQVGRIARIVQDLLNFSRKKTGKPQALDLNECIRSSVRLSHHLMTNRQINLVLDLDERLPSALGDRAEFEQVLINLLNNAVAAMVDGGELSLISCTEAGQISIAVQDTGRGINAEDLNVIFDPFFTTKDSGEGTGLGLSISYNIIDNMGGRIEVESLPGSGTTFQIKLPIAGV